MLHSHPVVLPGERLVLFTCLTSEPGAERIEVVSIDGGARSVIVERATTPMWSPTGHLLFARDSAMLAASFDPHTATLRGAAVPVMPSGAVETLPSGVLGSWLSSNGTLLYVPVGFSDKRVVSVGRDGAALALSLPAGRYANPRVSPDGRRLMVESGQSGIEVLDLARGTHPPAHGHRVRRALLRVERRRESRRVPAIQLAISTAADGSGDAIPLPGGGGNDFPPHRGPIRIPSSSSASAPTRRGTCS